MLQGLENIAPNFLTFIALLIAVAGGLDFFLSEVQKEKLNSLLLYFWHLSSRYNPSIMIRRHRCYDIFEAQFKYGTAVFIVASAPFDVEGPGESPAIHYGIALVGAVMSMTAQVLMFKVNWIRRFAWSSYSLILGHDNYIVILVRYLIFWILAILLIALVVLPFGLVWGDDFPELVVAIIYVSAFLAAPLFAGTTAAQAIAVLALPMVIVSYSFLFFELTLRRIAEYPKGPIVGFAVFLGILASLLKLVHQ